MKLSISVTENNFDWTKKIVPESAAEGLGDAATFLGQTIKDRAPRDTGHLADNTIQVEETGKWTYTVSAGDAESPAPPLEFGHRAIRGQFIPSLGKRVTVDWVAARPFCMPSVEELTAVAHRFFKFK